ncbi:hypothetical protein SAMN05421539_12012 [Jannaschia seohaensis]|uniref:Uncharacterized protein n=1 Tax=Jannaschia seohaensis TaxID=475081 RepID=A0A2Y9BB33_9RHOB|nr:hypothetical protein BCF38_12012 [Jannaschia seohaensis]SSA51469.1 hypothetical protein SAMN05421539_12012 [Jannaschia seohaensis]
MHCIRFRLWPPQAGTAFRRARPGSMGLRSASTDREVLSAQTPQAVVAVLHVIRADLAAGLRMTAAGRSPCSPGRAGRRSKSLGRASGPYASLPLSEVETGSKAFAATASQRSCVQSLGSKPKMPDDGRLSHDASRARLSPPRLVQVRRASEPGPVRHPIGTDGAIYGAPNGSAGLAVRRSDSAPFLEARPQAPDPEASGVSGALKAGGVADLVPSEGNSSRCHIPRAKLQTTQWRGVDGSGDQNSGVS